MCAGRSASGVDRACRRSAVPWQGMRWHGADQLARQLQYRCPGASTAQQQKKQQIPLNEPAKIKEKEKTR